MSMMRFLDQVVLVTGAARGQGRAHALAFAREGAHLILCDTRHQYASIPYPLSSPGELAQVAHDIETMGRQVIAMHVDVTDLHAMQQLANLALAQVGPINIAVANTGVYSFGSTWELTEQQWDETLAVVPKGGWITRNVVNPHQLSLRWEGIICSGST